VRELLECVVNVSEGRSGTAVADMAAAAGAVLDVHADIDHHRSVITLAGAAGELEAAVRRLSERAVELIDLRSHQGVHPRLGALDVVPFVTLETSRRGRLRPGPLASSLAARDRFAAWAAERLGLPCFLYGPERALPEIRRRAWVSLAPDVGPDRPHPSAGAVCVGARPVLVAYNLWLAGPGADLALARRVASALRRDGLRTLGLAAGGSVQVSCNLTDPWQIGPGAAYDLVAAALAGTDGVGIDRAELVGLLPAGVLEAEPSRRWGELGIGPDQTIEARLERAGLDGGRF
jgi:glutamate formiminotransferase